MNGNIWRSDSNSYPHIIDRAGLRYGTGVTARHRPTPETQMSATKPGLIMSSDCWFPMSAYVRQCRQCYIRVEHGRKCGCSRWNRFAMCSRSKVISTSGFHFRFRGRHMRFRCWPTSGHVGSVIYKSGMVENVEVAVDIALPAHIVQKVFPLPFPLPVFDRHLSP